ncbi:hypothetical protein [Shewanella holmiensis]|uniref:Uncharacterized protein n=1 Tax=Shewanella holmiensis TaxID=2952222 RepID=A0A9X2WME6_9GAMM|nr:hypothetical protein [Shewanella holmiensis]MCT7941562.1 hypothetical protein [Shewanella holmiensis]
MRRLSFYLICLFLCLESFKAQAAFDSSDIYDESKAVQPEVIHENVGPCFYYYGASPADLINYESCKGYSLSNGLNHWKDTPMDEQGEVPINYYGYPGFFIRTHMDLSRVGTTGDGWITLGRWHEQSINSSKVCPPEDFPFHTHGRDVDGDGEIDQCYNPEDLAKERIIVSDNICWKEGAPIVSTPSTSDEDAIKAAASSALEALNSLDSDMVNPEAAVDKSRLDGIAQSFSLSGYQDPDFHILASLIVVAH